MFDNKSDSFEIIMENSNLEQSFFENKQNSTIL